MTIKEKILSIIGHAPPPNAVDGVMIDYDILGYENYTKADLIPVLKAKKALLKIILSTADTANPESGMSIKYDRAAIREAIKDTQIEIDGAEEASEPTITSQVLW